MVLDCIKDPGNLGTIFRIADWFGIGHILCSKDSVDAYNAKLVQATMGAIFRVKFHYVDLKDVLEEVRVKDNFPVYGTFLDGENIYTENLQQEGVILMGNESKGLPPELEQLVSKKLYIPNYPQGTVSSESLNVSVATAIVCSEFRRRS